MPDVQPVDGGPLADEALVPSYVLPDLLTCLDGSAVTDGRTWLQVRRPEVLDLFRERMYGRSPDRRGAMSFDVSDHDTGALQGVATRKQVRVCFTGDETGPQMDLLIYPPNDRPRPPLYLGLNFRGNQTIHPDPAIRLSTAWVADRGNGLACGGLPAAEPAGYGHHRLSHPPRRARRDAIWLGTLYGSR